MQASKATILARGLWTKRPFSTSSGHEKIVASVLFERLPAVIPKIDPVIYAFQEFSFRWRQQYRCIYPDQMLDKADSRGKGDYHIEYVPAPRVTEADKANDRRYLQLISIALRSYNRCKEHSIEDFISSFMERHMGLLMESLCGISLKRCSEDTLRKCAESALKSVIGDLSNTYFVGNAPMDHMVIQPTEGAEEPSFKRFFFKSQVIVVNKYKIDTEDYVWVTKDELLEYLPKQAEYLKKMIIS